MVELVVQKYGGTSLQTTGRMAEAADRIIKETKRGSQVIVVVSAMGRTTDDLTTLAGQVSSCPPAREMDLLLSTGEQVSCALMAMALKAGGVEAEALTGPQAGIITDFSYGDAVIKEVDPEPVRSRLKEGKVVIVSGFQGCPGGHEVATLGRGGSDTTAAVLAGALKADRCEIFTDVDGVYTADPGTITGARKYEQLDYESLSALAELGASVVHPRAAAAAEAWQIPLVVRSSLTEQTGTTILPGTWSPCSFPVIGVTSETGLSSFSLHEGADRREIGREWKNGLCPWKAVQHVKNRLYRIVVRNEEAPHTKSLLSRFGGRPDTGRALVHVIFRSKEEKQKAGSFMRDLPYTQDCFMVETQPHVWSMDVPERHRVNICQALHDRCMEKETAPISAAH
ncbi:aspartate kinase [Halobacillus halophilus]|nr:aspartate kinase [Halobacillus halophilus]MYL30470.1 aspartate kinase [Halobacillus halophilus]